jgi:hypothetical protein
MSGITGGILGVVPTTAYERNEKTVSAKIGWKTTYGVIGALIGTTVGFLLPIIVPVSIASSASLLYTSTFNKKQNKL